MSEKRPYAGEFEAAWNKSVRDLGRLLERTAGPLGRFLPFYVAFLAVALVVVLVVFLMIWTAKR